ncbi:hypothetical protein PVAG01_11032 [Phlyctema vagabunda]|uniref:Velvet domain-containing protein n=1 Tax=Phlyctema vagabunda TaxID=108571 RepID=A0ABR4P3X4_9HELO
MLGVVVQPPGQCRAGTAIYPPVVATLRSRDDIYDRLSRTWAVATLVHYSGDVLEDQLDGRVSDSAHPMPERASSHSSSSSSSSSRRSRSHRSSEREQAYFCFPDLAIHYPGKYRIRVTVMRMEDPSSPDSPVVFEDAVDSHTITVGENDPGLPRLSSDERSYIHALRNDGQHIPTPRS